jgi:CheY-like chemotaxis protein
MAEHGYDPGGLPLASSRRAEPSGQTPVAGQFASRRILVVDDNVDMAEMLAQLLTLEGQEVRTAHDGSTALAAVASFQPQLVLLDIGLPGINGFEVASRIRQQPALKNVLLAALTGYSQEEDRQRCQAAGFDYHLVKPVTLKTLLALLGDPAKLEGDRLRH